MKIILDECLPKKLKKDFHGHDIFTVPEMGWAGVKNGKLLALLTTEGFEVFVTGDRNLSFQQNMDQIKVVVIVLHAASNRYTELAAIIPRVLEAINQKPAMGVIHI